MIERIRIRNYRSLHDVEVRLEPLTVLIGRSGSGKSNFVRAIRLLRDVVNARAGSAPWSCTPLGSTGSSLTYDITFRPKGKRRFHYQLVFGESAYKPVEDERLDVDDRTIFHQSGGRWLKSPLVSTYPAAGQFVLGGLDGDKEATAAYAALGRSIGCYDFGGGVLQADTPLDQTATEAGLENSYLKIMGVLTDEVNGEGDLDDMVKSLKAINQRIATLDLHVPDRQRLRIGYLANDGRTMLSEVSEESEGFRRYLAHLLALHQRPAKRTLIFEHPENGIHPGALEALSEDFKSYVADRRGQIILTTHSPQFLDRFDASQVLVVEMADGRTQIGPLASEQAETVRKNLMTAGELLTVDPARIDPVAGVGA